MAEIINLNQVRKDRAKAARTAAAAENRRRSGRTKAEKAAAAADADRLRRTLEGHRRDGEND